MRRVPLIIFLLWSGGLFCAGPKNSISVGPKQQFLTDLFESKLKAKPKKSFKVVPTKKDKHIVAGKVEGYSESTVWIENRKDKITGHIILDPSSGVGYRYSSENDEVFVEEVGIEELICIDYGDVKKKLNKPKENNVQIPVLESLPDADIVLLLDFDGYSIPDNSYWNDNKGFEANSSGFSEEEIKLIWSVVSEDYFPFNVNVTTNEAKWSNAYPVNRLRIIFTTSKNWFKINSVGAAQVGGFGSPLDVPCFVFSDNLLSNEAAEVATHEIGHALGLIHENVSPDLSKTSSKLGTIMGNGIDKELVHFSASKTDEEQYDHLSTISESLGGYKLDDHSDVFENASSLSYSKGGTNAVLNGSENFGLINTANDKDLFQFKTTGGAIDLRVNPVNKYSPNLIISLKLFDSYGKLLFEKSVQKIDSVVHGIRLKRDLPPGAYYLEIDGVGIQENGVELNDYNSMGPYQIEGKISNVLYQKLDIGIKSIEDVSGLSCNDELKPVVNVVNVGTDKLNSVDAKVFLNGALISDYSYTLKLNSFEEFSIVLDKIDAISTGGNLLEVELSLPNGGKDENSFNNSIKKSFIYCAESNSNIQLDKYFDILVYPNPTSDVVNFSRTIEKVLVYNLNGDLKMVKENCDNLLLSDFPVGVYLLQIHSNKNFKSYKVFLTK